MNEELANNEGKSTEPKLFQIAEEIKQMVAVDQEMREKSLDDSVWDEEVDNKKRGGDEADS